MQIDKHKFQAQFAEIVNQVTTEKRNSITWAEYEPLQDLAHKIGGNFQTTKEGSQLTSCYWICQNGFMCDPDEPDPSCINCHKICFLVEPFTDNLERVDIQLSGKAGQTQPQVFTQQLNKKIVKYTGTALFDPPMEEGSIQASGEGTNTIIVTAINVITDYKSPTFRTKMTLWVVH